MEDGDAELAVCVDVRMVHWVVELESWWRVGVIGGEGHFGSKVATVVYRIGVDDDEGHIPVEDVFIVQLQGCQISLVLGQIVRLTSISTHFSCERDLNSLSSIRSAIVADR